MESKRELPEVVNFQNGTSRTSSADLPTMKSALPTKPPVQKGFLRSLTSWRWRITILMHFALMLQMLFRLNMSLAIVCMMKAPSHIVLGQNMTSADANDSLVGGGSEANSTASWSRSNTTGGGRGEFEWESSIQGVILSSSIMLGFIMPLMADFVSRKIGGKRLLFFGTALSTVLTIAQPFSARLSPYALIVLRLFVGLIGGIVMPLASEIFSWWAPELEKVSMVAFSYAGLNMGNMVGGITSGYLCSIPIDNGWPFIFYVQGAFGIVWCVMWQLFGSMRPEDHPFVSEEEKLYITQTRHGMDVRQKRSSPPYKTIITSVPVWAFLGTLVMHYYTVMIIFTFLPIFLNSLFDFSIEEVGVFTTVMYVARFLGLMMWGQLSNLILTKTRHETTFCRKLIQCTGFYLCTGGMIAMGFLKEKIAAMFVLSVVMISHSASCTSAMIVPLDIAPRYSGFLSGLYVTIGSVVALPGPVITSIMTPQGTLEEWRNVFITMAVMFFLGATWFLVLGSAKLQDWAVPAGSSTDEEQRNPNAADLMTRRMTVLAISNPISQTRETKNFDFTFTVDPGSATPPPIEKSITKNAMVGSPSYTNPGFEPDVPNRATTRLPPTVHTVNGMKNGELGKSQQEADNGIAAKRNSGLRIDLNKEKEIVDVSDSEEEKRDVTRNDTAVNHGELVETSERNKDGDLQLRVSRDKSIENNILEQTRL